MVYVIGIDDAGRGPVLGPMVLAGVIFKDAEEEKLKQAGVKDSKKILPKKRSEIVKLIKEKCAFYSEQVTPEDIDSGLGVGKNLNQVEAIMAAKIINYLVKEIPQKEEVSVIIDCPSVNCEAWKAYVETYIDESERARVKISAEHKADDNHIVVGAASIIAKTTRDAEMEAIRQKIGINCGSGYASDPTTRKFLETYPEKYRGQNIIRESWSTFKKIQEKTRQKTLF